ncbi:MAG: pantetheine-phosphate adenylyltransferase [Gammaproteobacteria bacterium]|nr:MAG: pantetheine-phosphate adenylyltransferase [Gammaproteobacteria bacterium]
MPDDKPHKILFPGTFDPITKGHSDLIERARLLFDEVVVAVATKAGKQPMFSQDERVDLVREVTRGMSGVSVVRLDGLLVKLVREHKACAILRGLRAVSDFEYEFQMASMNRHLDPRVETVFLTPSEHYTFTSASLIREIATLGGDISAFVDPKVMVAIRNRVGR